MGAHQQKHKSNPSKKESRTAGTLENFNISDNRPQQIIQRKVCEECAKTHFYASPVEDRLPDHLKNNIEQLSQYSMGNVTVHYNSRNPEKFGAQAYTQGAEIHLGPGKEKHLPHEAWHVVQQMRGDIPQTSTVNGAAINDDPELEKEADLMGNKASAGGSQNAMQPYSGLQNRSPASVIVQRKPEKTKAPGEYIDPDLPGLLLIVVGGDLLGSVLLLKIAGTDIVLEWREKDKQYHFQGQPKKPDDVLALTGNYPPPPPPDSGKIRKQRGESEIKIESIGHKRQKNERPRAIEHIFGMDKRTKEQLKVAVQCGYRIFDAAETYSLKLTDLMDVIHECSVNRNNIVIIYKIGHGNGNPNVMQAALDALKICDGFIDILMLHENPGTTETLHDNLGIIQFLINQKKVGLGGISNINSLELQALEDVTSSLKNITVIQDKFNLENHDSIESLGLSAENLLQEANPNSKIIKMAYGILDNLKKLTDESDEDFLKRTGLTKVQAINLWIRKKKYVPVNSSSRKEGMDENLAVTLLLKKLTQISPEEILKLFQHGQELKVGHEITNEEKPAKNKDGLSDEDRVLLASVGTLNLYLAALGGSQTNSMAVVLVEMTKLRVFYPEQVLNKIAISWEPSSDLNRKRFPSLADVTFEKLNGFACNMKEFCEAIMKTLLEHARQNESTD